MSARRVYENLKIDIKPHCSISQNDYKAITQHSRKNYHTEITERKKINSDFVKNFCAKRYDHLHTINMILNQNWIVFTEVSWRYASISRAR